MPNQISVKKDSEKYASQYEVSGGMRKTVAVFAILSACGAMICAFTDQHTYDRACALVAMVLIIWEVVAYGIRHWQDAGARAQSYRTLADAIARDARNDESAESELNTLGSPAVGGFSRALGALANQAQWNGKNYISLIPQQVAGPAVVVMVVIATVWLAGKLHPETDPDRDAEKAAAAHVAR